MATPDDKTLDALISELRTYPGLYGDAGAKSADAIAALESERDALRKRVRDVEIHADATVACMQIRAERAEAEVATCKVCRAINLAADDMPDEIRRLRERIAGLEGTLAFVSRAIGHNPAQTPELAVALSERLDRDSERIAALEAERDALRQALVEQQRIDAQICRTAQDWSDGSLGWNRACERMALAIEKQTARAALEGK